MVVQTWSWKNTISWKGKGSRSSHKLQEQSGRPHKPSNGENVQLVDEYENHIHVHVYWCQHGQENHWYLYQTNIGICIRSMDPHFQKDIKKKRENPESSYPTGPRTQRIKLWRKTPTTKPNHTRSKKKRRSPYHTKKCTTGIMDIDKQDLIRFTTGQQEDTVRKYKRNS